ncbi:MAG: acetolactate decarboxylase [bacterium]
MLVRRCVWVMGITFIASGLVSCVHHGPPPPAGVLSQTSTITALLEGGYDGVTSCGELRRKGDFGIGTFDHLDGEMILIDGVIYQAKADGTVARVPDSLKVPFAAVTGFRPDLTWTVGAASDYEALKKNMDAVRAGDNLFLAIRVDGLFDYVKFRSVPPQVKPYPKLVDVAARQPVFERRRVKGSLVGFWCPEYVRTLNLPGYHLHFISEDRKSAGHLLDCTWQGGAVKAEVISEFHLFLPETPAFQKLQLNGDSSRALKAAESGR